MIDCDHISREMYLLCENRVQCSELMFLFRIKALISSLPAGMHNCPAISRPSPVVFVVCSAPFALVVPNQRLFCRLILLN